MHYLGIIIGIILSFAVIGHTSPLSTCDTLPPEQSKKVEINELRIDKKEKKKRKKPSKKKSPRQGKKAARKAKKTTASAPKAYLNADTSILSIPEQIELLARKEEDKNITDKVHPDKIKNCMMAFDVVDEFTGREKRGLYPRLFFTYTPDNYRKFLKDKDFMRCEGYLTESTGNLMTLNLKLVIASKQAKSRFGAIKANSSLILHTMEDRNYFLTTYAGAQPKVFDNQTIYECSFAIEKSDARKLSKAEIDQAQISFKRGVFSYEVYYLDFLKDQFPCFGKK